MKFKPVKPSRKELEFIKMQKLIDEWIENAFKYAPPTFRASGMNKEFLKQVKKED